MTANQIATRVNKNLRLVPTSDFRGRHFRRQIKQSFFFRGFGQSEPAHVHEGLLLGIAPTKVSLPEGSPKVGGQNL